mmetsp:Transcript_29805/g.82081  ORF Transcript_29805/g.82081 Transcript_29805/m.82081 type:complete len:254 (+) Transcript_29805:284-1045(+)
MLDVLFAGDPPSCEAATRGFLQAEPAASAAAPSAAGGEGIGRPAPLLVGGGARTALPALPGGGHLHLMHVPARGHEPPRQAHGPAAQLGAAGAHVARCGEPDGLRCQALAVRGLAVLVEPRRGQLLPGTPAARCLRARPTRGQHGALAVRLRRGGGQRRREPPATRPPQRLCQLRILRRARAQAPLHARRCDHGHRRRLPRHGRVQGAGHRAVDGAGSRVPRARGGHPLRDLPPGPVQCHNRAGGGCATSRHL